MLCAADFNIELGMCGAASLFGKAGMTGACPVLLRRRILPEGHQWRGAQAGVHRPRAALQPQRVAIARALAPNPSVLLLDEPTSGAQPSSPWYIHGSQHAAQAALPTGASGWGVLTRVPPAVVTRRAGLHNGHARGGDPAPAGARRARGHHHHPPALLAPVPDPRQAPAAQQGARPPDVLPCTAPSPSRNPSPCSPATDCPQP